MYKTKLKKIKIGDGDGDISEMFNQMLGTGDVDLSIAYPRYRRIHSLCQQLTKLFRLLSTSPWLRNQTESRAAVETFCSTADTVLADPIDFSEYEFNLTLVEKALSDQFKTAYETLKSSDLVNTFVMMCDRLVPYKKSIADIDHLSYKFVRAIPGPEWTPFPFAPTINIKSAVAAPATAEFVTMVLHKAYVLSRSLYDETQSPDIDVDRFVDVIIRNIGEIEKRPELNRCGKAFRKIRESVVLLKERFGGYYRDFIMTKDSSIIMQHFILDVSKQTDADPLVTQQFRQIIGYYRKVAQSQITNPQVKKLFDRVNESFEQLERNTKNLKRDAAPVAEPDMEPDETFSGAALADQ